MKKIFLAFTILLSGVMAFAQNRITGVVKDTQGEAVIGAAVIVEGTTLGVVTDVDGKYSINIPAGEGHKLTVASLSYKSQTVEVGARSVIDFILQPDTEQLEEVVFVGYGSMKKSDLTGSVTSVKVDEENAARSSSIDQLLQGRAAGVQVISNSASPDGGVSIRIRGLSSFTSGATEPLYVMDGVIINGGSSADNVMASGGLDSANAEETNNLMGINPQDIAHIEILKDASATAIYGSLGANGVVLITTKSANKDKPVIKTNFGVDIDNVYHQMPMLSFDEYVTYLKDSGKSVSHIYDENENLLVKPMNWQDVTLRTAISQRYYISISGRPKTMNYWFSAGYNKKQGIVKNTAVDQLTMRLSINKTLNSKLKIGARTNFSYLDSDMTSGANASRSTAAASMIRSMLSYRPYISLSADDYDPDELEEETYVSNPTKWLNNYINNRRQLRITPNVYVEYKPLRWLSFNSTLGADYNSTERSMFKAKTVSSLVGSIASAMHYDRFRYNWDNMINANTKFGSHSLTGTVGMSMSRNQNTTQAAEGWYIIQDRGQFDSINSAENPNTDLRYTISDNSLLSFFARGIYNYKDRYVITATYRFDGSSKFAGANKWAQFPSFAFAWRLNRENWFNVPVISMAKIRLGWGRVGNQSIGSYRTKSTYGYTNVADHSPDNASFTQLGLYPNILPNIDLKWETTEQLNAGLDLGLWRGRFTMTADFYNKNTIDLLQNVQIAKSSGFSTMPINSGSVLNRGIELTMEAVPLKAHKFEWTVRGNISFNRGSITSIGSGQSHGTIYLKPGEKIETSYFYGSTLRSSPSSLAILNWFIEGQPIGVFYGFKTDGVAQFDGDGVPVGATGAAVQAGDLKYVDINGNGYIDDDDRTIIGDPNPDFTFGFGTAISWGGLSLNIDFNGSYGNDIYNLNNWTDYQTRVTAPTIQKNIRKEAFYNAWSVENPNGTLPRLGYEEADRYSDLYVEDGSYLRLSNLSLGYDIPLGKNIKKGIKGIYVGVSGQNLIVFTKYSGWDPDVNSFGSDIRRLGVDMGSYPSARTVSCDLKLTF